MPLITTLIPTYRRPELLRRAVYSALNQEFNDLQVLVFDNASGDKTADVVHEIMEKDRRVHYFCHDRNIGAYPNFQHALASVNTPYYSFLSDDDVLMPGFYQKAMKQMRRHPEAAFLISKTIFFGDNGRFLTVRPKRLMSGYYAPPRGFELLVSKGFPTWTGLLFKQEHMSMMEGLDMEVGLWSDYEYLLRTASQFPYVVIDDVGALYASPSFKEGDKGDLLHRPEGYLKLYDKIEKTYTVPANLKRQAINKLRRKYLNRLKKTLSMWIVDKDMEKVTKAVAVLRMHGEPLAAAYFQVLGYFPRYFGIVGRAMTAYRDSRKNRKSKRSQERELVAHENEEYSRSLDYLKELSEFCNLSQQQQNVYICGHQDSD
jgi:glycosyltransferase involved in cell wall biosynthesis